MTIHDKVVPGMVGVDIGCGMETVKLKETEIDFEKLDYIAKYEIPSGFEIREVPHAYASQIDLHQFRYSPYVNLVRAERSVGTLGGGNHFIEVDRDEDGAKSSGIRKHPNRQTKPGTGVFGLFFIGY